jgi:hypothetical protein
MANLTYRVMLRDIAGGTGGPGSNTGTGNQWWLEPVVAFVDSPPADSLAGTRYIVADAAYGDFLGREKQIATRVSGVWAFQAPKHGYVVLNKQTESLFFYDGVNWISPKVLIPFDGDRPITRNIPAVYYKNMETTDLATFTERVFFTDEPPILNITASLNAQDPGYGAVTREIGNVNVDVTLYWSVQKKQRGITLIFVDQLPKTVSTLIDEDSDAVGAEQRGTDPAQIDVNGAGKQTFTLQARDTLNADHYASTSAILWWHRCYFGALSETIAQLKTRLATESPYSIAGLFSAPASSRLRNHNYDCTGGKFIYYLYPLRSGAGIVTGKGYDQIPSGTPGHVKNGVGDFSAFDTEIVTIKDRFGINRQYVVLYTEYQTGDSVNINIIN